MPEQDREFVPPWQRGRGRGLAPAKPIAESGTGPRKRTPYQQGRAFEQATRGRLERRGYFVMRAAMSKGKIDLLAVGLPCLTAGVTGLFIQCKRRGDIGSAEWNEVCDLAWAVGGWPMVVTKLSERTVGFYRLDAKRVPRKPGRPWTLMDPRDLSELLPPPTLMDAA